LSTVDRHRERRDVFMGTAAQHTGPRQASCSSSDTLCWASPSTELMPDTPVCKFLERPGAVCGLRRSVPTQCDRRRSRFHRGAFESTWRTAPHERSSSASNSCHPFVRRGSCRPLTSAFLPRRGRWRVDRTLRMRDRGTERGMSLFHTHPTKPRHSLFTGVTLRYISR